MLFVAGRFETAWAPALKESDGFLKPGRILPIGLIAVGIVWLALAE